MHIFFFHYKYLSLQICIKRHEKNIGPQLEMPSVFLNVAKKKKIPAELKPCAAWKPTFCGAGLLNQYEFLYASITDSGTTCICRYQSGLLPDSCSLAESMFSVLPLQMY